MDAKVYATRDDAIEQEIIPALGDDVEEYDLDKIFEAIFDWHNEYDSLGNNLLNESGFILTIADDDEDAFWRAACDAWINLEARDAAAMAQIRDLRLSVTHCYGDVTLDETPEWDEVLRQRNQRDWVHKGYGVVLAEDPGLDDDEDTEWWRRGDEYLACTVLPGDIVRVVNIYQDIDDDQVIDGAYDAARRAYETQTEG